MAAATQTAKVCPGAGHDSPALICDRLETAPPGQAAAGAVDSFVLPGDRYRIVGEIARGGMGVVLRAHDASFDRPLAIKVLLTRLGHRANDEMRFLEEAALTGQLQHPGIPPAHEVGRLADGRPYFSMKLIEGRTLAELLRQRPDPQTDVPRYLQVFEQIAQTLAYAHSRGVIHRDLKPLNIMVGAFGEVQVMDWGLAKRLNKDAASSPALAAPRLPAGGEADAAEMLAIESDTEDARTQAGQVLGTFSYMAPEQACGKVHELDERCDVFGLGGILCTILTGRPPYHGTDARRVWRQAAEADLADAWSRLDQCGADGELIALAKRCLAKDKPDRPRHAGEVAQAIAGYLASVQQRLEQARLAQAKAEVQAREERKRRRLVAVLGLVVLLLIGGATAASLWYVRDQGRKEAAAAARRTYLDREVAAALDEAERLRRQLHQQLQDQRQAPRLLSDLDQWRELLEAAHAAWRRGDRIAAGDREMLSPALRQRLETLAAQLQADDKDRELAVVLDRTRLESFDPNQGEIMLWKAAPKLSAALIDGGYNLEKDDLEHVAARISQSPIRLPLVAAIDFYATVTRDMSVRRRLMETASRADPDPWRDRLRQPSTWKDKQVLTALANEVDLAAQTPQALAALSLRLRQAGGDAALLLQRALVFHPRDFSLFFELGHASTDPQEQMGAFRAAASIRPDSPYPYYALGVVYYTTAKLDQAEACYRKALQLDDKYASAHGNLGLVLADRGQLDQAIACYERAIELDPHSPSLYSNLGGAYKDLGQPARAVAACRRAIELDPDFVPAYINLAIALRVQEALGEAEQCLRHATTMAPHNPWAWGNLGHVLTQQGRFQEGLQALQRAHELGLKDPRWPADRSSEWIQESQERIAANEKLPAVLRGEISLESPRELLAFSRLCLFHKKMFAAAARFYAAAEAADPQLQETQSGDRYNSACAAVLASSGQGVDANQLSDDQGRELRQQALVWLRVELAAWLKIVDSAPAKGPELAKVLRHWQRDPDLSGIRDETALARLAADEQQAFRALWAEVAARRKRWEAMAPSIE